MTDYNPQPVDLSHVQLPEGMDSLRELLAAHNHDTWAANKMSPRNGYVYGKETNDQADPPTHCDLIPYEDLDDEKKKWDRDTAEASIRLLIHLGYTITKGG